MINKVLPILLAITVLGACKKPDPDGGDITDDKATPTGTLLFHLHTYISDNEVDGYGFVYTNDDGRQISLSMAQLYITDIQVVKLDGSLINLPDTILLKTLALETYVAGKVPVGNYKGIQFKVGLSAATDAQNPVLSKDSAALNHSEMWFGSSAQSDGHVFLNVQGSIDTTSDLSGLLIPFSYKIGTQANLIQVKMPQQNFSILENQAEYGHIIIDYNRLFSGIQLNSAANLQVDKAGSNSDLAQKITVNIPSMFRYE
ncbi:MAG: MbnP family protein [Flavobacteriales bacterium]